MLGQAQWFVFQKRLQMEVSVNVAELILFSIFFSILHFLDLLLLLQKEALFIHIIVNGTILMDHEMNSINVKSSICNVTIHLIALIMHRLHDYRGTRGIFDSPEIHRAGMDIREQLH